MNAQAKYRHIAFAVSRAIRQGRWLDVLYHNKKNENTRFLFSVKDIDLHARRLSGDCFNPYLAQAAYPLQSNITLDFNGFLSAGEIANASYDVPASLINKLEMATEEEDWLKFNELNNNVFAFLEQCIQFDTDPSVAKFTMLAGIDADTFARKKKIAITKEECRQLIKELCKWKEQESRLHGIIRLHFNVFSVKRNERNLPIVYREVLLNLSEPSLSMGNKLLFSKFYLLGKDSDDGQLFGGLDCDSEEFFRNFEANGDECIDEIRKNLGWGETINTNPEFMPLIFNYNVQFRRIRIAAADMIKSKTLPAPIKAFLGKNAAQSGRRRNAAVVTYDSKVNIDQVRVVFNALRENITYVEGPPGTGKTQTILNVILSLFFEGRSCIVCSNNNLPIEGIIEKLTKDLPRDSGREIPFPILRVGNKDVIRQTIETLRSLYEKVIDMDRPRDEKTQEQRDLVKRNTKSLSEALSAYEEKLEVEEKIDSLQEWKKASKAGTALAAYLDREIEKLKQKNAGLKKVNNEDIQQLCITGSKDESFIGFLYNHSVKLLQRLQKKEYESFVKILYEENSDIAVKSFKSYISDDDNIQKLLEIFPVWVTTNISAEKIGSSMPHFDLCIMDESGQCDIARSLIPMIRARRLLLVGDTNQLRPIILLDKKKQEQLQQEFRIEDPKTYDYVSDSILSLMMQKTDKISKKILLSYHYRCPHNIIEFSNYHYYKSRLHLENKDDGTVLLVDVNNHGGPRRNSYEEEAEAVAKLFKSGRFDGVTVAVITPFNNQVRLIREKLKSAGITNAVVGTIHKVQGMEYNTVILSCAVSQTTMPKTFRWIKDSKELINVAGTRPTKELVVVADTKAVNRLTDTDMVREPNVGNSDTMAIGEPRDTKNALWRLVNYVQAASNGKVFTAASPENAHRDFSNNSEYERQFFATLSQVLSVAGKMTVRRNVPVREVFPNYANIFPDYYSKSEFDTVLYRRDDMKPVLAVELDGPEHSFSKHTKENDHKKEKLCMEAGIKLFRVPNVFASHYTFIKDYIAGMPENPGQAELFR